MAILPTTQGKGRYVVSSTTTREQIDGQNAWGLHTMPEFPGTKCLEGTVRTPYGFALVATFEDATLLELCAGGFHYKRRITRGPIFKNKLVTLAGQFARDVHNGSAEVQTVIGDGKARRS